MVTERDEGVSHRCHQSLSPGWGKCDVTIAKKNIWRILNIGRKTAILMAYLNLKRKKTIY